MTPITGPAAWTGADFQHDHSWIHHLSDPEIAGLDAALEALAAGGRRYPEFSRDQFPIGPLGQALPGLSEALDLFHEVMHDPAIRLDMMLEPGDLQFANNYAVLHSRTAFQDHDEPSLRRRMLRLWLKMPNARPLAPEFPGRNGFPRPAAVPA